MTCATTIFLILFFVILLISFCGCCGYYKDEISTFANVQYKDWEKQMQHIKDKFDIAKPTGVLSYKQGIDSCDTKQNLLVQNNVAFKPVKHGSGCTYIDQRWPE